MLNFTTTTIVNSMPSDFSKGSIADGLYIKNVGSFTNDQVTKISKKESNADTPAKKTVTIPANSTTSGVAPVIVAGDIYRLVIDIELYKSDSSLYARPWPTKGKPVYVEAIATSATNSDLAALLVANAEKYMNLVYDKEILKISSATNVITIEGIEGTQILKSVSLEHWVENAESYAGGKWVNVVNGVNVTDAKPGFGTYQHLIHNVVLPTYENMRYGSPAANVPELDATYTQFVITKEADRDPYGMQAVGQKLTSVTEHVFWVKESGSLVADFAALFANETIETVSILED